MQPRSPALPKSQPPTPPLYQKPQSWRERRRRLGGASSSSLWLSRPGRSLPSRQRPTGRSASSPLWWTSTTSTTETPSSWRGVVFVWLVVIPLVQEYFKKYKAVGAIDAFRKIRDVPEAQLLNIRQGKSVRFMAPPNPRLVGKSAVQVDFDEEDKEGFLREVKSRFPDPANTVVCVLDNFDGNSMKVAELLFNNGFKEAYAIKGGLRGPEGWQAIQENYLPPSVHVFPRKKKSKKSAYTDVSTNGTDDQQEGLTSPSSSEVNTINGIKDGQENPNGSISAMKPASSRPLSPYPNYHDMKPPSSPTPSKPER